MATFYIQLENKLLQISGELTAENISKALGYVPVSPNVTNELSQKVDNITFDSLKDNPFLQDGSGELNIVDEAGNIIAKVNSDGIHSVDFITGEHRLSNKTDKTYVDEAVKNVKVDLTGYATEEYVNNIDFYNIKDNPIVNNGDGKLLFVDENGYIGLQLEENGLYVKDVIADGHTLSQKANKSDIPSLDGYATESYVTTNLQNYATKDEVSDLVDMSVVTELQGKVNTLVGEDSDKSVRTIANEELAALLLAGNDNLQSLQELAAWIDEHPEDASAMNEAIQTNTSNITKLDSAYKEADAKVLTDANEYTDNINFYTIKDNPIVNGEAGSLTFVDETGYIGLKVTEDGIIVKDVVTSEHKLSDKANASDIPTKVSQLQNDANYITTADIPSLDEYVTETELNDKGYLTEHLNISHLASKEELNNIDFYSLQNNPVVNTEEGKLLFVDESGNIGLQLEADNTLYVKDVVGDGHILSNKQDSLISGTTIKTINGESIIGSGDLIIESPTKVSLLENDANYILDDVVSDGVYAVNANGKLIDYNTADATAIGVALITANQRIMIEKMGEANTDIIKAAYDADAATNTDYTYFCWGMYGSNVAGITNSSLDVAKQDFNGKANTAAIIATPNTDSYTTCANMGTYCTKFNEMSGIYSDWYVPALGQLWEIYTNRTDINTALTNIGGTTLNTSGIYWSSSEYDSNIGWNVVFTNGQAGVNSAKNNLYRVRFVRDISVKSLKERVDDLESNKQDIIEDLDAIRDGASKGATALQEEQYKGTVTSVKINGTTKTPDTNGMVDLGTIEGGGGSSSGGNGAYAEVNHGTGDTTFTLTPNTFHVWDEVDSLDLSFADETANVANEYLFQFTSGATATTLTLPDGLKWTEELVIEANRIYQVSILNGLASMLSWDNAPTITLIKFTVDDDSFDAEPGMLWSEWVASNYNTSGYIGIRENKVTHLYSHSSLFTTSGTTVSSSDVVQPIIYTFTNPWA